MKSKFKIAAILFFFTLANINCKKTNNTSLKNCYKVKYAGEGCGSVIEVIEGDMQKIKTSAWGSGQSPIFEKAIGIDLPDKFKDGNIFYIKILEFDINTSIYQNCSRPVYLITKFELSNENCDKL